VNFLGSFSKNTQMSNFMKIRPVGAELYHQDGHTDMTKLIVAYRNFATRLKIKNLLSQPQQLSTESNYNQEASSKNTQLQKFAFNLESYQNNRNP
jgi:hypothetical protein